MKLYKEQKESPGKESTVWNRAEYNSVVRVAVETTKTVQAPTQSVARQITQMPSQTVIQEEVEMPLSTVTPALTNVPCPEELSEIKEGNAETKKEKVTVKYNGKEIAYRNTSYRLNEETMEKIISMICKEPYVSSFVLYDIDSEATISYNEERYYPVASTIKAPFAMTCLWQMEDNPYFLDAMSEYMTENNLSRDEMICTIKEMVEKSVTLSDNNGYLMLQEYFGYECYNQFLKDLGNRVTIGNGTKWGKTSAIDSARNWKEIYKYIYSDRENACYFADLLKRTNKGYIRNVLGEEYEVYNKMGWVSNQCCHDHAIVMDEAPYILIIMTMGDVGIDNQRFMEDLAIVLNEVHEEMVAGVY